MKTSEKVIKLLSSKLTSYKIAKDNGFSVQYVDNLRNSPDFSKVATMGLIKAEKLADYYDTNVSHGKIRSLGKQQWLNIGTLSRNAEEAKDFLAHNVYDWKSKESALSSLKHAFKQGEKTRLSLQGKSTELGSEPENYVSWLEELTVDDMADK
ncbi:hypothetical protein [Enterococcus italicus]|uniref:hypothetical protein n=1 Tax=Enterococcus italicus TaxID=246144 RepID=UPI003F481E92